MGQTSNLKSEKMAAFPPLVAPSSLPSAGSLLVLQDAAREAFGDDAEILLWLQHPDAVRQLIRGIRSLHTYDTCADPDCHSVLQVESHYRLCKIGAALRALKDPRALVDIDLAHEEARLAEGNYQWPVMRPHDPRPLPTGVPPGGRPSPR